MKLRRNYAALLGVLAMMLLCTNGLLSQDSWESVKAPPTGRIFALNIVDGLGILAGTEDGGMFLSTDNGLSWNYHALAMRSVRSFYKHSDNRVFAGQQSGASVSTDNGSTWESLGLSSNENGFGIAVNSSGHIFVAGWREGMNRSTDNGVTWEVVVTGMDKTDGDHVVVDASDVIYAGMYNGGLYRSTDNGDNWLFVDSAFTYKATGALVVKGSTVFAAIKYLGIYHSTDHGVTWTGSDTGFDELNFAALVPVSETELFAATASDVYRSTDAGITWVKQSNGGFGNSILSMVLTSGGRLIVGTNWNGILYSDDNGATWINSSQGLTNVDVNSFAVGADGRLYVSHRVPPVASSTDHGMTWMDASDPQLLARQLFVGPTGNLYAASYTGLFMTTDKGSIWTADTVGMMNKNLLSAAVTDAGDHFAASRSNCYRRLSGESSWTDVTNELAGYDITCMAAAGSSIFVGTERDGLYRSSDNGASWTDVSADIADAFIHTIVYDAALGLYIGCNNAISHSSDLGATWTKRLGQNHPGNSVTGIVPVSSDMVVSSSGYQGISVLSSAGGSWVKVNSGLYNTRIKALIRDKDGYFYAGTKGNGIFRNRNLVLNTQTAPSHPSNLWLSQNYPNPFNPSTTIRYGLPLRDHVSLKVHTMLGVEVAVLVDCIQEPGFHTVSLQGANLPSGQYFYQLRSGNARISRSMLLIK